MDKKEFDLIILGAGLVGLTAANLCAKQGLSVAVIETKLPSLEWPEKSYDLRCSAISRNSQTIFEKIGVWENIVDARVSPYQKMVVWDAMGFGEIQFDAAEVAEPNLGHIIENRVMIKALWDKAKQNGVFVQVPARPLKLQIEKEAAYLELEDKTVLKSKIIVGADGGRSWVRETAQLKTTNRNYHQQALVATVKTEIAHQNTAWQRFLPEGPLAFLPLSEPDTSSIVWSTTEKKMKALMAMSEAQFCQALAHAFDYRLGKVLSTSERLNFPLTMMYAKQCVAERIALIGDAAHVIHPLAGQGVNLGLSDAECLAEVLGKSKNKGYDVGNYLVLRKYERARKGAVLTMIAAMEFFKQTFGSNFSLIAGLRSFGLNMVNNSQYLKKQIVLRAMGVSDLN